MIALLIVLAVLLLGAWVVAVYGSWRIAEGREGTPVTVETLELYRDKTLRLARRIWYSLERLAAQVLRWSGKKTSDAVVKVFPTTAPVFAEKPDALTGLSHGPSSYFLKSISPEDKKLTRVKKDSSTV